MNGTPPSGPLGEAEAAALFEGHFQDASGILVAVSGGPDSMALMALLARWAARPPLAAATVDHGLRAEAADEARLVAEAAAKLSLSHATLRWEGAKPRSALQEAARDARHALLGAQARALGFSHIALAHHADDQAETVLMRLAAGSGLAGLVGMRRLARRGDVTLARPLLGVAKARLIATCQALGLAFAADPSNDDPRFGRTRARKVLAAPEGLTAERLKRLALRAARAEEALERMTDAAWPEGQSDADWRALAGEPAEIRLRILDRLLKDAAVERPRLERLEALLDALDAAAVERRPLRRSIGDRIATLDANSRLTIAPAPPRRRGRHGP